MQRKVVFLGESGIGKTTLIAKILGIDKKIHKPTIGVDHWISYYNDTAYIIIDTVGSLQFYQNPSGCFYGSDLGVVFTRDVEPSMTEKKMGDAFLSSCPDAKVTYIQLSSVDEHTVMKRIHDCFTL
jgi:GTPase SAR1 family protein